MNRPVFILSAFFLCVFFLSAHNVPQENSYPLSGLCRQDNTCLFTAPRTDSEFELAAYLTPVSVEDLIKNKGMEWYLVKYNGNLYYTAADGIETDKKNFLFMSNFQAVVRDRVFCIRSLNTGLVHYQEPLRLPIQYQELYPDLKVSQKYNGRYLEVSVGGVDVTGFLYGLYDTLDRKWRLRFDNRANQNVIGYSADGKYAAVDSGTSASVRRLDVFNLITGKNEMTAEYNASVRPCWTANRLVFYKDIGYEVKGLPPLERSKQVIYARRCAFEKGQASALDVITNLFTE